MHVTGLLQFTKLGHAMEEKQHVHKYTSVNCA